MQKKSHEIMHGHGQKVYARLASDVARELSIALHHEEKLSGLTKAEVARRIGRDKAFVTRAMGGHRNLQLRTVAALLGAMGYVMDVKAKRIDLAPEKEKVNTAASKPDVNIRVETSFAEKDHLLGDIPSDALRLMST